MYRFVALLVLLLGALPAWANVNLNTANQAELESLPGIGESKAAAIIQYRADHGGFKSVDELDNVSGIGPSTLASLRDLVTVGTAADAKGAATSATTATATVTLMTTPSAPSGCAAININSAEAGALESLPGIGASKAAAIVQYRTDHGKFATCDELDNVSGIGAATLTGLRECCVVK